MIWMLCWHVSVIFVLFVFQVSAPIELNFRAEREEMHNSDQQSEGRRSWQGDSDVTTTVTVIMCIFIVVGVCDLFLRVLTLFLFFCVVVCGLHALCN